MRTWKRIAAVAATTAAAAAMSMTAFAGVATEGASKGGQWQRGSWQKDENGWWWLNEDGTCPKGTSLYIDGNEDGKAEKYFFDENGYMLSNTVVHEESENPSLYNSSDYYLNADGAAYEPYFNNRVYTMDTSAILAIIASADELSSDNGGYNAYGCSNVAMEMFANSREENEKFKEINVTDDRESIYVVYANGFGVVYPKEGFSKYKIVAVDSRRTDLDHTYLFQYYDSTLGIDEAVEYLHSVGFSDGIRGAYANGTTVVINAGKTSTGVTGTLNWHPKTGYIGLR